MREPYRTLMTVAITLLVMWSIELLVTLNNKIDTYKEARNDCMATLEHCKELNNKMLERIHPYFSEVQK